MSKIETQLEINGKTYAGKDLDLILLGMSIREERIMHAIAAARKDYEYIGQDSRSFHAMEDFMMFLNRRLAEGEK